MTTCGFQTTYPHHPIIPPKFIITHDETVRREVQGRGRGSAWDCLKLITEIEQVPMVGHVMLFEITFNNVTYGDDDHDNGRP